MYEIGGQSPWIDDLKRSYVRDGELARLVEQGIRGVTSNPTIMAHSIEAGSDYDKQFGDLISSGSSVADAYWDLVLYDVKGALSILRPVYDGAKGGDGFVSVEVDPGLAHDQAGTIAAARQLHERIAEPNLFVKIPATAEGVGAIQSAIGDGESINVTLIFSLDRYAEVIEAYLTGLEHFVAGGGDPSNVASVASFFVSRIDTEVDRRLDAIGQSEGTSPLGKRALELRGQAAIAQARIAYQLFSERFATQRFAALAAQGARVQRPLWASTSTKNPAYPDLLYVEGLIGPDTVDTMPDATVAAFLDHGVTARTVDENPDGAHQILDALAEVGIDLAQVTAQLEQEAVASFSKSFEEVGEQLESKATALKAK
jgi:transaldolase